MINLIFHKAPFYSLRPINSVFVISRQIFYNEEKGQALLLVNWENKKLWKNISSEEVHVIQNLFEMNVKKTLNISENPFQLIYEGELFNQK